MSAPEPPPLDVARVIADMAKEQRQAVMDAGGPNVEAELARIEAETVEKIRGERTVFGDVVAPNGTGANGNGAHHGNGADPPRPRRARSLVDTSEDGWGTELWFARRIVTEHGRDLRFVGAWRKWMDYRAPTGRWGEDLTGEAWRRAQSSAGEILREAIDLLEDVRRGGDSGQIERAQKRLAVARRFYQQQSLDHAIKLAATQAEVVATPEQWDRDPWLFGCANGVLDLRTGSLRPAAPADYLTRGSPVNYDEGADAPTWYAFLERVLPDPDVRAYVQVFLGYCLTGLSAEHLMHVAWGSGANGKSTLINAASHVLGDYACAAPEALLMKSQSDRHETELATLHMRRLVAANETDQGGKLNEARVKWLTGGDKIRCRRMREDQWEFSPTHKLILCTNHRPRISGTDHGIWRRIRLVPFTVQIPKDDQDTDLEEKLKAEAPGILAWMVEGCRLYQRDGLAAPPAVLAATEEYRTDEDDLAEFVLAHLVAEDGARTAFSLVHLRYGAWAEEEGIPEKYRLGAKALTRRLKERGYADARNHGGQRVWVDLALRPSAQGWQS